MEGGGSSGRGLDQWKGVGAVEGVGGVEGDGSSGRGLERWKGG